MGTRDDNLVYDLGFSKIQPDGTYRIREDMTLKQWFIKLLDFYKGYIKFHTSADTDLDRVVFGMGINAEGSSETKFSDDDMFFDAVDAALAKKLLDASSELFGRFTVVNMLTGTMVWKNGQILFVTIPFKDFVSAVMKNQLGLVIDQLI